MSQRSENAHQLARRLASVYGHALDEPLTYPTGVAFSGRLRLAALDDEGEEVANDIARIAEPFVADPWSIPAPAPCLAAACFGDELSRVTDDNRHQNLVLSQAQRFTPDPDIRVEDFFFGGTLLGRAWALTHVEQLAERLTGFLGNVDTQQDNGLFWHCHASPFFWGRCNAFAALGFAEALTYVDAPELEATHIRHLEALVRYQDDSGLWHQLIDDSSTYLEHSATSMIGYAIARGLRRGILDRSFLAVAERAFAGIAERTGAGGELDQVCVGTGPLDSLEAYVDRPFTTGVDARGGAMALWFATEMALLD